MSTPTNNVIQNLRIKYWQLCGSLEEIRNMAVANKWWHGMEEAYQASFRHAHDAYFIVAMQYDIHVATQGGFHLTAWEADLLDLLCFFAYIDFDPRNPNHFKSSADMFADFTRTQYFRKQDIERGVFYIENLKSHSSCDPVGGIFMDADWTMYDQSIQTYDNWIEELRKEYSFLNDEEWREHRAKELLGMQGKNKLFTHPKYGSLADTNARQNIEAELKELYNTATPLIVTA